MTDHLILLPVLLHLFFAIVLIFLWKEPLWKRIVSIVANVVIFAVCIHLFIKTWQEGILTTQAGSWPAPFGITFVSDVFSSVMLLLTSAAGLAVSVFSSVGVSEARIKYGYYPILHFLLMGLSGAFLTGDIFNLYVWFEIIIISSFVLLTLGGRQKQIGGGIKYVALNLLASVIFLTAIAILYGLTGSLNLAHLSLKVAEVQNRGLLNVAAILFFIGFGIKSAVFPLYFWLPSSYHTPPSAIAAVFGGLLTKVGVYALLRVFTLIFVPDAFLLNTFAIVAIATLLTGAFGALIMRDIRRMFSYLIVCHIGYLISGLALFTEVALTGMLFYLIHDIMVKTNLFLATGVIYKIKGTIKFFESGGLYADYPRISLLIAIVLFSLVGIPPLSGFWPKIYLIQESLSQQSFVLLAAILVASFFTLYVVAKMWAVVFWRDQPAAYNFENTFNDLSRLKKSMLVGPVIFLAIITLYVGFGAENIFKVSRHIAGELLNTAPYVKAVLGPDFPTP
ncbi:MAG TPA: proton-conducting transporter membrane subunit [Flavisolibacter sp.]|jgi:multicomponent Na+:H+ antiporter subunit D|nr:proton-conducting transporter membrane subunit [Flavisolibacter sp.]